jgi:dihydrodiol dehydrogenase / D-xylose 1-dehydrogenase (NADP)
MASSSELRWGVIGTGWIADMFVKDILAPRTSGPAKHILASVGASSSIEKSEKFIDDHWKGEGQRPKAFGSYQEVYDYPEADIVYIATPHTLHKQNCLDAIKAGKHVLCEKPFTINSKEAEEVVAAAKAKGVFLMEGMNHHSPYWTKD